MDGERPYIDQLTEAVERRRESVEREELPRLPELFAGYHATYRGLHSLFVRKGLVRKDPYPSETKSVSWKPPPDDPYLASERDTTIGDRMDRYDSLLERVLLEYPFTNRVLGFAELKDLTSIARYIDFEHLSAYGQRPTTQGVAELVSRLLQTNDALTNGVTSDALSQLARFTGRIVAAIGEVVALRNEEYKLLLRREVLPSVGAKGNDGAEFLEAVRAALKASGVEQPYMPELVAEALAEDRDDGAALRSAALARLHAAPAPQRKPEESPTAPALAAIRTLASSSRALEAIADALRRNDETLRYSARGIATWLRDLLDRLIGRKRSSSAYKVELADLATESTHTEQLVLDDLVGLIERKSALYAGFLVRSGSAWQRLTEASVEQLWAYLDRELAECHDINRKAAAIDAAIKQKAAGRPGLKGVKIELTALTNAIVGAHSIRQEHVTAGPDAPAGADPGPGTRAES